MKLSENFTLQEFLKSATAIRHGFKEQFTPPKDVVDNLQTLCVMLLQPIRNLYGMPIRISSGYRCKRLNKAVKGKPNSQHLTGQAADIDFGNAEDNLLLFNQIKEWQERGLIDFDQLIDEYKGSWVHISYNKGNNRNQVLRIK